MYNRYVIKYKHPNINAWKTKKKQNTSHWKWTIGFWKGFNDFDMCSIFIGNVLHLTVFYLDYIQNPTIVQFDTLCVSLFHLPVFWYLCIPPSCVVVFRLNFVLRGVVGALDDRGETDVRAARDPGIPIKFTPSTPHCSAVQILPNTNTPKYVPLQRDPVHWLCLKAD